MDKKLKYYNRKKKKDERKNLHRIKKKNEKN